MTTSIWPAGPDNLQPASSPGILPALIADAVNAMQAGGSLAGAAPAFTSGTAVKNTYGGRRTFSLATATAGTATVVITEPDGATNHTLVTSQVTAAVDRIEVSIDANWSVKITLATSTGATDWVVF